MSLPLRRAVAERYGLDAGLAADPASLRALAHALGGGRRRDGSAAVVHAGDLQVLVVLFEVLVEGLGSALDPDIASRLEEDLGSDALDSLWAAFDREFRGTEAGADPRRRRVELLLALWLLNRNPALSPLREMIGDDALSQLPQYRQLPELISEADAPSAQRAMIELARSVSRVPGSLREQLDFVLDRFTGLAEGTRERLLRARDALAEDEVRPPPGPGPPAPPALDAGPASSARPLPPRHEPRWMRELVVGARNAPVWLRQLERRSGRRVRRLDEVPDAELERLAATGLGALWLIGVWERSPASRRVKQMCGSRAVASAYSIFDYRVADELGGDEALEALQEHARRAGLRLGVDVVPNHMGLDSVWLRRHPERFLSVERSPFPTYRFEGPDLSGDPMLSLHLEDHYVDRSDAAVVFVRVDRRSGERRFVYHGNDGTGTPWNDTAQLDYTRRDTRRGMAEIIVSLARRFPLLRFDAAMTLTRQHFQRLWFPAPGDGGAIPSRSEHGLGRDEFTRRMPVEFWRQVCDLVAEECPDALLVAEAFWLMEGFFLRELGMPRVYNSAFMRLLAEGDGAAFRGMLRETLKVDPRILERYAGFLTNPDEATAVEQFGRGDRYFGACTLLATLPGLPLFGHGQIEGLAERYGMDFDRPERDEQIDRSMLERHLREIAPLLRRRDRFAAAAPIRLLRFVAASGETVEDVIAWRGGTPSEPAIVLFNNGATERSGYLVPEPVEGAPASLLELTGIRAAVRERRLRCREERRDVVVERPAAEVAERGLALRVAAWESLVLGGFELVEAA